MFALTLLLVCAPNASEAALVRYERFVQSHPAFQVKVAATSGISPEKGYGTLRVERDRRFHFEMKWGDRHFVSNLDERGALEIEHSGRVYDERPFVEFWPSPSRISWVPDGGFPEVLLLPDLRELLGPTPTHVGVSGEEGTEADVLEVRRQRAGTTQEHRVLIDSEGRLLRFEFRVREGRSLLREIVHHYSGYRSLSPEEPWPTRTRPLGYRPHALPSLPRTLEPGETIPGGDWTERGSGQTVSFARLLDGQKTLLVVVGDKRSLEPDLGAFLTQAKEPLRLRVLSTARRAEDCPPNLGETVFFDPSGERIRALKPTATPSFYLVDGEGTILRTWCGFDRAQTEAFLQELRDAWSETDETSEQPH